jgi:glutamate-1-semialdehyde aminotransferase
VVADPRTADAKGPAVDKNQVAYDAVRASVQKLVDGLNKHAQKARIAVPIADAGAKLAAADTHDGKKEWAEAAKRLAEAKTICSNSL